jgi:hypothetical protein
MSEKVVGSITWYLIFSPMNITSVLAISRWYQISFPFRNLNKTAVEVFLAVLCILEASYFSLLLFTDTKEDPVLMKINTQTVWNDKPFGSAALVSHKVEGIIVIFLSCLSMIASGITIRNIMRANAISANLDVQERKTKSTVKITLLNLGNLVYISAVLFYLLIDPRSQYALTVQTFMMCIPFVQSTYNPVIYTGLTRNIFKKNFRVRVGN